MSWATIRAVALAIFAMTSILACSDSAETRLIEVGDPDFSSLESPENAGECTMDSDCEVSCVHACAPPPSGPVTCPMTPPPVPDRVAEADCVCSQQVCAWF